MNNPPHWYNVYPQGTREGDEEQKFFTSLARNNKWNWRSVASLAKETGLTKERVEQILYKYYKKGLVFQNPKNDEQWGYWDNVPEMLTKQTKSINQEDLSNRLK